MNVSFFLLVKDKIIFGRILVRGGGKNIYGPKVDSNHSCCCYILGNEFERNFRTIFFCLHFIAVLFFFYFLAALYFYCFCFRSILHILTFMRFFFHQKMNIEAKKRRKVYSLNVGQTYYTILFHFKYNFFHMVVVIANLFSCI